MSSHFRRLATFRSRLAPGLIFNFIIVSILALGINYAYTTDTNVYAPPQYLSFQPPAVGGSYADPVFGSAIKRLTNAMNMVNADRGGNVTTAAPEYSSMSPFNKDNTRLLIGHFSYFGLYDGAGNFLKELPLEVNSSSQPRWSRDDANVLYYIRGNQLKQFNVGTMVASVVHTFSEYSAISGNFESDICFDGDHFVLAGNGRYIFVYEISTGTKGAVLDAGGRGFDSLYITPDDHVTITWLANGSARFTGIELFDRNMNFMRQLTHAGGHMDVTRDTNGDEVLVWAAGADNALQVSCDAGVVKVRLSDGKQTCIWKGDWNLAVHVSGTDNSGWAFIETYAPGDPIPPSGWNKYTNEIVQAKLDGTEVRRIAHHRSRPFNSYTWTPRVSASRDGTKLVFASNYGLQAVLGYPAQYSDAYMIDLGSAAPGGGGSTAPAPPPAPAPAPADPAPTAPTPPVQPAPAPSPGAVTRIEQNGNGVTYTGVWHNNSYGFHSASGAVLTMTAGARANLAFNGTGVTFVTYQDPWSGIAKVFVDGSLKGEIDTYASPAKTQAAAYAISGLASGNHNLTVEVTGRKNASSGGAWVWVDAFDVTSGGSAAATPPPPTPTAPASQILAGSAEVKSVSGRAAPSGLAILGYRQGGVLVSEAGVPASSPVVKGRIYAEVAGAVNTGIAITNPNDTDALVSFVFTDETGTDYGEGNLTLPPRGQIARFLDESPFGASRPTNGTFTFSSNVPVSAAALRGLTNERNEFLITALPISDPGRQAPATMFFPHLADGGGWKTQFILVNPSDAAIAGTLAFYEQGVSGTSANPLALNIGGTQTTSLQYSIPPRSSRRYSTQSANPAIRVGSAQIVAAASNATPAGLAIFSFTNGKVTVTEAGVAAVEAGTAFRMYAEAGGAGAAQTGIAVRNSSEMDQKVIFQLTGLDGTAAQLQGAVAVPGGGQRVLFLSEIPGFESLSKGFAGVLRVSSSNGGPIAVTGLRGRVNERGDFLITTTSTANDLAAAEVNAVFPYILNGGGYTTQFILYSGTSNQAANGSLQAFSQTGMPISIDLFQ